MIRVKSRKGSMGATITILGMSVLNAGPMTSLAWSEERRPSILRRT